MTKAYTISLEDLVNESKNQVSFGALWTLKVEEITRNICNPYPLQYYGFPELTKENGKWPDKAILEVVETTIFKKILPKNQHIWMAAQCSSIAQLNGNVGRLVQWALWDMRTPLITDNLVRRTKKILIDNYGINIEKKRSISENQFTDEVNSLFKCIEPHVPVERTSEINPKKGDKYVRNPKVFNSKTLVRICAEFVSLGLVVSEATLREAFERKLHGKPGTMRFLDLVARYEVDGADLGSESDILDTLSIEERDYLSAKADALIELLEPSEERCLYLLRKNGFFLLSESEREEALGIKEGELEEVVLNMQSKVQGFCEDAPIEPEVRGVFQDLIWKKIGIDSNSEGVISDVA
jgi:hypothetical protein